MMKLSSFNLAVLFLLGYFIILSKINAHRLSPRRAKPNCGPSTIDLTVNRGQITFDSEGNDDKGSQYFSRVPHVPTSSSGITLGRGYDLKERKKHSVLSDLESVGIKKSIAQKFSNGVGLSGSSAKKYLRKNKLQSFCLTHQQQKVLFYIAYDAIAKDAKRLATKKDVEQTYGTTDWNRLNTKIKEVVVDLRYRGDYTPTTRRKIQKSVAKNDLKEFTKLMSNHRYWVNKIGVPTDRFKRRENFLKV